MSREWKSGDVAMVTYRLGQCMEKNLCAKTDKGWDCLAPGVGFLMHGDVYEAHPVVVIDPEDRDEVKRLHVAILEPRDAYGTVRSRSSLNYDDTQVALREFANPTPPKPDEPLGLGAVVATERDGDYVRISCELDTPWYNVQADTFSRWPEVNATKILSEGVVES